MADPISSLLFVRGGIGRQAFLATIALCAHQRASNVRDALYTVPCQKNERVHPDLPFLFTYKTQILYTQKDRLQTQLRRTIPLEGWGGGSKYKVNLNLRPRKNPFFSPTQFKHFAYKFHSISVN